MYILLSNDDGVHAEGINCLRGQLQELNQHRIVTIAPDRDRSGNGCGMTLRYPLYPQQLSEGVIQVDGSPVDCVHIAITGYLNELPDCVISGINHGANMGDDVVYSGTVGAALEGRHLARPALAVSLAGERHFETAAQVVRQMLEWLPKQQLASGSVLNVNVPDLPIAEIRGWRYTRLGRRALGRSLDVDFHPRAAHCLWIGASGNPTDEAEGTDFHAVRNGFVSITPLSVDLTDYQAQRQLAEFSASQR